MKKLNYIILLLLIFITKNSIKAQYAQGKENLIAPSPTVEAMVKYGQIPVSYNTGIPSITIPLYTLKCGDLTLPITLDYHAGGIRVNDVASWVGLGWNLNAGGVINVAVQGRPDSYPRNIIPIDKFEDTTVYDRNALNDFLAGPDTQPDIYNYQVGSYAGQFMVDLSDNNLKTYNVNDSKDILFKINDLQQKSISAKDQLGNLYTFDSAMEQVNNNVQYYQYWFDTNMLSTWRNYRSTANTASALKKIVNANKTDSITFGYNIMWESYNTQINGNLCWGLLPSKTGWSQYINPFPFYSNITDAYPEMYSRIEKKCMTRKINTITTNNGIKIILTATTDRKDLNYGETTYGGKSLDKIEIFDSNNNLLKKWEFLYDYFTSYITNTDDDATNYRLKLVGLKEYGKDLKNPKIFTFSYYGDSDEEAKLPYRNSFSGQDYWGYCNKEVTTEDAKNFRKAFPNIANVNFIQYYRQDAFTTSTPQSVSYTDGENKSPNENYIKACSLKQITYPTGGNTTFEYESNKFSYWNADIVQINQSGGGQRIKRITSNPVAGIPIVKEYLYTDEDGNSSGEITNVPKPAKQKVWQITGISFPQTVSKSTRQQSYLELKSDCSSSLYTSIGSGLTYSKVTEIEDGRKTIYNYFKREDQDENQGANFNEDFLNIWAAYPCIDQNIVTDNLESMGDCQVAYYKELTSDQQTDSPGYWGTYYKHGTLKSKEFFNNNSKLIFKESYGYKDVNQKKITGLQVYTNPDITYGCYASSTATTSPYILYNTYCYLVGLCRLTSKTTTQYDINGENPIVSKEEYTYNDDNLLAQIKTTNSSNDIITINNKYPSDINVGVYSTMKQLNMLNYPIETIKKKNNLIIGGSINTYQQVSGTSDNMYLPNKIYQADLSSALSNFTPFDGTTMDIHYYSPNLEFLTYNTHGNVCEIRNRKGITTIYLWSYFYQYPVAKIEGLTYSQVQRELGQVFIDNLASNISPDNNILKTIHDKFANYTAFVTTYTYSPLIGMTSATDPNGVTTYYEYDSFGRLKDIKDKDQKILKHYEYHYQNQ